MRSEESDRVMRELRDELLSELESVQPDAHGFLDAVRPEELVEADHPTGMPAHDHESDHDHEKMHFEMFRREPSGKVVAVDLQTLERNRSTYDEDGNDPGAGPPPAERGGGAPEHDQHGHAHDAGHAHGGAEPAAPRKPDPARKPAAGRKPKPKPR